VPVIGGLRILQSGMEAIAPKHCKMPQMQTGGICNCLNQHIVRVGAST